MSAVTPHKIRMLQQKKKSERALTASYLSRQECTSYFGYVNCSNDRKYR